MSLKTLSGKIENIKQILVREVSEQKTYNLSIADSHTYFIGNQGILVHNADEKPNGKIYVGRDPKTGEVIYVGQTKQDLDERIKQHRDDAKKSPDKYKFKKDMDVELVMDGLTDDEMDYHERRVYDKHGGEENIKDNKILKNRQLPMTDEKINALKAKHCK
jgi:predicted GIY-YIG superfamily endonuclease